MTQSVKNIQNSNDTLAHITLLEKTDKTAFLTKLSGFLAANKICAVNDLECYAAYKSVSSIYIELAEEFFVAENETMPAYNKLQKKGAEVSFVKRDRYKKKCDKTR